MSSERDLPESWQWARFGEVATIESNLVDPAEHPNAAHIAPNHIESGTGILLPYTTIKADKVISPKHTFKAGQIIYSKIRPYLAKAALVDFTGLCSADMYPVSTRIDAAYLHRWLISPEFTAFASENQGRTLLPKINQDALVQLPVPIPPLAEQRRIATKLEALTAKSRRAKEALDAIPALLERFRKSVLAAAFRGDLTADWREKNPDVEPAEELLKRIRAERRRRWEEAELAKMRAKGKGPGDDRWKERYEEPAPVDASELPELPEGWAWASVEELATKVVDGVHKKPIYTDSGIPFLTVKNLTAGPSISFEDVNYVSLSDHKEFIKRTDPERGDILISKDGTLGVTRLIRTDIEFSIFVSLALVKPVLRNMGEYLELAFLSPYFQERFKRTGSGLQHIHLVDLRTAALPLAPIAEHNEIVRRCTRLMAGVQSLEELHLDTSRRASDLDNAILAKAFRGELVPQDPSDEPASVLLERLRVESAENGTTSNGANRRRKAAAPELTEGVAKATNLAPIPRNRAPRSARR